MYFLKITYVFLLITFFASCEKSEDSDSNSNSVELILCGKHNGNQLFKGPRDGCYYNNSNDNKTYVDRSECTCL